MPDSKLVDRQGRLTPDGVRVAGRLAREIMADRGIDGGAVPPDIIREARRMVQSHPDRWSPSKDRKFVDAEVRLLHPDPTTLEAAEAVPRGKGVVRLLHPDPTTLEAVEAVPGGEEKSFEEIQAGLRAEGGQLNPRFPDPTTLDAVEAVPGGEEQSFEEIQAGLRKPYSRMGSFVEGAVDEELMRALEPAGNIPAMDAETPMRNRSDKELNLMAHQAGIEMSMATEKIGTAGISDRDSSKARMERQQATEKLRQVRSELDRRGGGGPQEGPAPQEFRGGGVVGLPSYDEGGVVGTRALEELVAEQRSQEPVGQYAFDPSTSEAAALATLEALGDPRVTAASLALPMARPAAAMARAGLSAAAQRAAQKKAAERAAVEAFERRSAAYWKGFGETTPAQQAQLAREGHAWRQARSRQDAISLTPEQKLAMGIDGGMQKRRMVNVTPLASLAAGSATGQHDDYGDPLGLGERGARAPATDPGAPFKEYGQAAVAMDAMLNRIQTKQRKGIELSSAERAALIDPRAVLQTLQEYGTFTSAPAEDQINYILRESGRYREGGAVYQTLRYPKKPTETALVGEEGPELVLTPMEARKQAMQMRRAARAERILQRGEEGAERIRARGKSEIPGVKGAYSDKRQDLLLRGEQPEIPDYARWETAPRDDKFSVDDFRELQTPGMGSGHMTAGDAEHYEKIKKQGGLFTGMELQSFPPKYGYVMPGDKGYDAALKRAKMGMGFDPGPGMSKEEQERLKQFIDQYQDGGVVGTVVGQSGPEVRELEKGSFVLTADQTAAVNDAMKRKGLTRKQRMGLNALKGK